MMGVWAEMLPEGGSGGRAGEVFDPEQSGGRADAADGRGGGGGGGGRGSGGTDDAEDGSGARVEGCVRPLIRSLKRPVLWCCAAFAVQPSPMLSGRCATAVIKECLAPCCTLVILRFSSAMNDGRELWAKDDELAAMQAELVRVKDELARAREMHSDISAELDEALGEVSDLAALAGLSPSQRSSRS